MKTKTLLNCLKLFMLIIIAIACTEEEQFFAPMMQDQTFEVSEVIENGTIVGKVQCLDIYESDALSYLITNGNELGIFKIDSLNGNVMLVNTEELPDEAATVFKLTIQVENVKGELAEAVITIKIKKETYYGPMIADQEFILLRTAEVGTKVGRVVSLDLYKTDSIKFSILDGNIDDAFSIDENSGDILLLKNDFLTQQEDSVINLIIQVVNIKGETEKAIITIDIRNSDYYAPMVQNQMFSLNSNAKNGQIIGQIIAMDLYDTQSLKFSFTEGQLIKAYEIDSESGAISVLNENEIREITIYVNVENIYGEIAVAEVQILIQSDSSITKGLVLYLPFDGNLNDESGNENNGIHDYQSNYVSGIRGSALRFDGLNDQLFLSKHIDCSKGLSFSLWLQKEVMIEGQLSGTVASMYKMTGHRRGFVLNSNTTSSNSDHRFYGAFYTVGATGSYGDGVYSYYTQEELATKTKPHLYKNPVPKRLEVGEWTHCVLNLTENEIQVWLDGVLCATKTREYFSYGSFEDIPICIGNNPDGLKGDNNHFSGIMDEFRIYDRDLSKEEIQILYRSK